VIQEPFLGRGLADRIDRSRLDHVGGIGVGITGERQDDARRADEHGG
jgi:hypothetical protein